ncbi:hypothetical protein EDD16DRAFT_1719420 [Pisolithus croceorrhizus]|nr:hypothetical protein EDD16DRAFT_1719420 [Pisolithus croceorrhizus]
MPFLSITNPNSTSPPLPPVPHNSFDRSVQCESEDESSGFAPFSLDSHSSSSDSGPVSPSLTTLSAIYGFPPLPLAPPHSTHTSAKPSPPDPRHLHDYQNGVMMSAKRIQAALCAAQSTERPRFNEPQPPRKPIPGFSPHSFSIVAPGLEAKPSFAAFTAPNGPRATSTSVNHPARYPRLGRSEADQLDVKVVPLSRCLEPPPLPLRLPRRVPVSPFPPLPPTSTTSTSTRRCRNNLLAKAGGRLLVLNVTVLPHHVSEDSMLNEERSTSDSVLSQPSASVRTYPVMMPPPGKGKRIMTRITLSKDTLYTPDSFCSLTMVGTATRTRDLFSCLISLYSASHTSP